MHGAVFVLQKSPHCAAQCSYNIEMVQPTKTPATGAASNIQATQLREGMTLMVHGEPRLVASVVDDSPPLWMRPNGHVDAYFLVTLSCGYRLTLPKINTVQVVA